MNAALRSLRASLRNGSLVQGPVRRIVRTSVIFIGKLIGTGRRRRRDQYTARPPDRSNVKPVVKAASGETINATMAATSSNVPQRFIGILSVMYLTCAGGMTSTNGVWITAGASALMVTPVSAYSLPWTLVR